MTPAPHAPEPTPGGDLQRGLRMAAPPDPEALAREAHRLEELDRGPRLRRWLGWLQMSGPGYLQSALTLGAGTATASLFSGAVFGYRLLWVAPVGMAIGVVMLAAIAHQTLSTGLRPLPAMRRFAGAPFAIAWAAGALLASVVWHVPQYTLAASAMTDLLALAGAGDLPPMAVSPAVLLGAVWLSWSYGRSPQRARQVERFFKWLIWATVLSMLWVVLNTDTDWGAALGGFVPNVPADRGEHAAVTMIVSGLAAAVGVNMVFLYPYSLLARGWGRAHRGLARCDLWCGMLLPYTLATALMGIAAANTLHRADGVVDRGAATAEMSEVLGAVLGATTGQVVFDLGLLAMAFSTISLHMLVCGFVATEWFGCAVGSRAHRLWTLLPTPAVLAPLVFHGVPFWLSIPTNIVCGLFLPLTYLGFVVLMRSRAYLGADRPTGPRLLAWTAAMTLAILVLVVALTAYLVNL
ncbi:MAG: NRAMP family divalent metal transporter [Planctomycetota bacterium]